jgi:hypothetical protein
VQFCVLLDDLVEGMALHAFEGKSAFNLSIRQKYAQLKEVYDIDFNTNDVHQVVKLKTKTPVKLEKKIGLHN